MRIAIKQEYSKTLGRTIALYWKHSVEAVRDYVRERISEGIKPTDPVFRSDYVSTRKLLQRLGEQAIGRSVHYHLFRHSSCTFYATKLNRQELCYRYGWRFSSDMPDIYISRAGMESRNADEKFVQTELSAVKAELVQIEQREKIKDERIRQMEESMTTIRVEHELVLKALRLNPTLAEALEALKRRTST